jgi:hypothetical protein
VLPDVGSIATALSERFLYKAQHKPPALPSALGFHGRRRKAAEQSRGHRVTGVMTRYPNVFIASPIQHRRPSRTQCSLYFSKRRLFGVTYFSGSAARDGLKAKFAASQP